MGLLTAGRDTWFNPTRITASFYSALDANGFAHLDAYDAYLAQLRRMIAVSAPLTVEGIRDSELGEQLGRFIKQTDGPVLLATYVWPTENLEDLEGWQHFTEEVTGAIVHSNAATVTGSIPLLSQVGAIGARDLLLVALVSLGAVLGVSLLRFRNVGFPLLPLVTLIIGWVWMLGLFKLVGVDAGLSICCAAALTIGIGIDDGVHFMTRFRETQDIRATAASTGRAMVLTSLTTGIAFGSLLFAEQTTLTILGLPVLLGVFCCLMSTLLVMPAVLALFSKREITQHINRRTPDEKTIHTDVDTPPHVAAMAG